MKLIKEEFEAFAIEVGFENGAEVFEFIGYTEDDYEDCVNGRHIERGLLLRMYRCFGTDGIINCIAFGSYEWELNIDLFDLI